MKVKHKVTGKVFEVVEETKDKVTVKKNKFGTTQYDPDNQFRTFEFFKSEVEFLRGKDGR